MNAEATGSADLRTEFAGTLAISGLAVALGALSTIIAPRLLGKLEFGRLSWALAVVYLAAAVGAVGLPMLVTAKAVGQRRDFDRLFSAAALLASAGSVAAGSVILAVAVWAPSALGDDVATVARVAALCILPAALNAVIGASLRSIGRAGRAAFMTELSARLALFVALVVCWVAGGSATAVIGWYAVVSVGFTMIGWIWTGARFATDRATVRTALSSSMTFFVGTFAATLIPQAGVLVLAVADGPAAVADLSLAIRIMLVCSLGSIAGSRMIGPRVVRCRGRLDALAPMIRATSTLSFWVTIVLVAPFVLTGRWLTPALFGSSYRSAWPATSVLLLGLVFTMYTGFAGQVLFHAGYERSQARRIAAGGALYVGLAIVVSPVGGAPGVALAAAVAIATLNVLQTRQAERDLGLVTRAHLRPREAVQSLRDLLDDRSLVRDGS